MRLTAGLGLLWAVVTLAVPWIAAELTVELAGFPLGYWMAAQGALLAYLAITVAYAWRAERLEAEAGRNPGTGVPGE